MKMTYDGIVISFSCRLCTTSFDQINDFIVHKKENHSQEFHETTCIVFEDKADKSQSLNNSSVQEDLSSPVLVKVDTFDDTIFNIEPKQEPQAEERCISMQPNFEVIPNKTETTENETTFTHDIQPQHKNPFVLLKRLSREDILNFNGDYSYLGSNEQSNIVEFPEKALCLASPSKIPQNASTYSLECKLCHRIFNSEPQLRIHVQICLLYNNNEAEVENFKKPKRGVEGNEEETPTDILETAETSDEGGSRVALPPKCEGTEGNSMLELKPKEKIIKRRRPRKPKLGVFTCGLDERCAKVFWCKITERNIHLTGHFARLKCSTPPCKETNTKHFTLVNYTHVVTHTQVGPWSCPPKLLCPYCDDQIEPKYKFIHVLEKHRKDLLTREARDNPFEKFRAHAKQVHRSRVPSGKNVCELKPGPLLDELQALHAKRKNVASTRDQNMLLLKRRANINPQKGALEMITGTS